MPNPANRGLLFTGAPSAPERNLLGFSAQDYGLLSAYDRAKDLTVPRAAPQKQKTRAQTIADLMSGTAIATTFMPWVGDLAGMAADAAMYSAYPEQRNMLNYGLTALSALPLVPAVSAMRSAGNAADAARLQRAADQGFISRQLYHGTAADIAEFKPQEFGGSATKARSAKMGTWLVDNPEVAEGYARFAAEDVPVQNLLDQAARAERAGNFDEAERLNALAENLELGGSLRGAGGQNVMPLRARGKFFEVDADGATMSDLDDDQLTKWAMEAKEKGFDGLQIKNFSDNADYGKYIPATHYLIFNPSNIRSVNAAFDPAKRAYPNLLAGLAGAAVVSGSSLSAKQRSERKPD